MKISRVQKSKREGYQVPLWVLILLIILFTVIETYPDKAMKIVYAGGSAVGKVTSIDNTGDTSVVYTFKVNDKEYFRNDVAPNRYKKSVNIGDRFLVLYIPEKDSLKSILMLSIPVFEENDSTIVIREELSYVIK